MNTIKSFEELKRKKTELQKSMSVKGRTCIKVHMGTSGLASGARQIFDFMKLELEKRNIDAVVTSTGDMGYCFAEPTVEVQRPGEHPVVYGNVDKIKADEIIEKFIKNGEYIDGIIPANYQTI
jgi:NADP-reducing hydrogenase subunit HndB